MKLSVALFYHSLVSDWNHGNAHFLRGIAAEMIARGYDVRIYEPRGAWSLSNLIADQGIDPIRCFEQSFPDLRSVEYGPDALELDRLLASTDIAIVHEWNDPELVRAIGSYRRRNGRLRLFFHDTHHRIISAPDEFRKFDLQDYDGVLAYGASLKSAYERQGWSSRVHVWHEAADTRVFYPRNCSAHKAADLVWIGNWGDNERSDELRHFFIEPVRELGLRSAVYGVRYPQSAIDELQAAWIDYRGWVPNFEVPTVFSEFAATVHIPRSYYRRELPGIPTIRPFEALACGIPLISAPWSDSEGLFRVGVDFLMVRNGAEMREALRDVLNDESLANSLSKNGRDAIRQRHTCAHRVDELLSIYEGVKPAVSAYEVCV